MPRIKMNDRTVRALQAPASGQIDYFDEKLPGFGLRITSHGHRAWSVLYRYGGRLRRLTLGPYPALTLANARAKAKAALHDAANGNDPASQKKAERRAETFAELGHEYMERHAKPKKRSWREDERILARELLPGWRHLKAKNVTRRQARTLLDKIVARGAPIQANRTLALGRKLYNFGIQEEIVDTNPFRGIPRPAQEKRRERVLSFDELRTVWRALDAERLATAAQFRLLLVTAQRPGEVRTMRREDIDLSSDWWTIPAEQAKNGRTHRVPLSPQARTILADLLATHSDSPWVFPAARGSGPTVTVQTAVARIRHATGIAFTPHDLRRTAASHMTGMGIPRLTVSKILNHMETGVTAIYDRYSYDPEKRQALVAWGVQVERILGGGTSAKVLATAPHAESSPMLTPTTHEYPPSIH